MKGLLIFLLGMVAGAFAFYYYEQRDTRSVSSRARDAGSTVADRSRQIGNDTRDTVSDKLRDWHLTSDDIKADLSKTGEVVRSKARIAGDKISDARITSVVKAKYVLDRDLSARDISVDTNNGEVTLNGTVASTDLIGRAVALALDTDGVTNVVSRLSVR